MKPKLRFLLVPVLVWAGFFSLPVLQTGCRGLGGGVTLAPGGVYTDPALAVSDQSILDADKTLLDFVAWHSANATALARWPQIADLAGKITAQEPGWTKDAYAARDAYRDAAEAYRKAIAAGNANAVPPNRAKMDAAFAVLTSAVTQVLAYKSAHAQP